MAQQTIYDSVKAVGGIFNRNVTSGMLTYVRQSHLRYQACLKQRRPVASKEEEKPKERKRATEKIKVLEEKRSKINEAAQQEVRVIDRYMSIDTCKSPLRKVKSNA